MAPGLCFRIFEHLKELGLLKDDSTVLDCMGGIGTTALVACSLGLKAITVELEPKFVALQEKNKVYLEAKIHKSLDWTILQGDSRNLSQILGEKGLITVTSPPYANRVDDHGVDQPGYEGFIEKLGVYGESDGQIGNLPDKPLTVMSPPYKNQEPATNKTKGFHSHDEPLLRSRQDYIKVDSDGNIGQEQSESYLSAMSQVYSEIAKVSNVLVIVLKNPTRNGKLRRLDLDTIALLESLNWHILCVHQARLFEEQETQDLFGASHKKVKGRLSFFKRLSYQKGSPVADHEDVIFAVRDGASNLVSVTSLPYGEDVVNRDGRTSRVIFEDKSIPDTYGLTPGQIGNLKDS